MVGCVCMCGGLCVMLVVICPRELLVMGGESVKEQMRILDQGVSKMRLL